MKIYYQNYESTNIIIRAKVRTCPLCAALNKNSEDWHAVAYYLS